MRHTVGVEGYVCVGWVGGWGGGYTGTGGGEVV
jgi:hypothetical protein